MVLLKFRYAKTLAETPLGAGRPKSKKLPRTKMRKMGTRLDLEFGMWDLVRKALLQLSLSHSIWFLDRPGSQSGSHQTNQGPETCVLIFKGSPLQIRQLEVSVTIITVAVSDKHKFLLNLLPCPLRISFQLLIEPFNSSITYEIYSNFSGNRWLLRVSKCISVCHRSPPRTQVFHFSLSILNSVTMDQ